MLGHSILLRLEMAGAARYASGRRPFAMLENQTRTIHDLVRKVAMPIWQIQNAKARLSEVIERARSEGPQTITRHGAERAIVLSIEDYRALIANRPDFKEYLLGGPKVDDFSIKRERDTGRAVKL
jgi:antitoxin Phd